MSSCPTFFRVQASLESLLDHPRQAVVYRTLTHAPPIYCAACNSAPLALCEPVPAISSSEPLLGPIRKVNRRLDRARFRHSLELAARAAETVPADPKDPFWTAARDEATLTPTEFRRLVRPLEEACACTILPGARLGPLGTVWLRAGRLPECIVTPLHELVISTPCRDKWVSEGFTGMAFFPVAVRVKRGNLVLPYWEVHVTARAALHGAQCYQQCVQCGYSHFKGMPNSRLEIAGSSWRGSDLFVVPGVGCRVLHRPLA
jgi:hypothetical protein